MVVPIPRQTTRTQRRRCAGRSALGSRWGSRGLSDVLADRDGESADDVRKDPCRSSTRHVRPRRRPSPHLAHLLDTLAIGLRLVGDLDAAATTAETVVAETRAIGLFSALPQVVFEVVGILLDAERHSDPADHLQTLVDGDLGNPVLLPLRRTDDIRAAVAGSPGGDQQRRAGADAGWDQLLHTDRRLLHAAAVEV